MAERWPDEISFRNDLAYLDLLLNRNVESATKVAEDLVEAHPGNLPFRAALALGRLRSKNPSTALEAFAGRDWDWTKALPGHRAIHAAALAAAGRAKEAAARAGEIPPDSLRREERQLLESALAGK